MKSFRSCAILCALLVSLFAALPASAACPPAMVTVADTLYDQNGSLLNGTVFITNPLAFTSPDGCAVAQNQRTFVTVTNGAFTTHLIPNVGSVPSGTSYQVEYTFAGGVKYSETWVVPASGPTDVASVRAITPPSPSMVLAISQLAPPTPCLPGQSLFWGPGWICATVSGTGTVTSVSLALPNIFNVSGSPVTAAGTLTGTLANQSANRLWAGPPSGSPGLPSFRALVSADIPIVPIASGGLNNGSTPADGQVPIYDVGTAKYVPGDPIVSGPDAPGDAPTRNPVQIGAFDGSNVQRVSSDTNGRLNVNVSSADLLGNAPLGALNDNFTFFLPGVDEALITFTGSGLVGTVSVTAGLSNALTSTLWMRKVGGQGFSSYQSTSGTITNPGAGDAFLIAVPHGTSYLSLSVTAYTSGSVTARGVGRPGLAAPYWNTVGQEAPNAAAQIAGSDGANLYPLPLTGSGAAVKVSGTVSGTFWQATQPVSGTVSVNALPTGANVIGHVVADSGSTTGVTGNVTVVQPTGTNLHTVCDSGCSGSAGFADNASFTAGSTVINPIGGLFDDTPPTAVASGKAAGARITNNRALHINLRNQAGTELGTASAPIQVSLANTAANATAVKVDNSAVTQPVSGTVTTAPPANASTNVAQVNGVAVSTGTGVMGTGVQRVAIASDNDAVTVKQATGTNLHAVIDSGSTTAVTGNVAVTNAGLTDLDSTTQTVSNGVAGTKSQLMGGVFNTTLPTLTNGQGSALQSTAKGEVIVAQPTAADLNATVTGTVTTTPPANASTNVAQVNGVTTSTGTGVMGTGVQRVAIASDNDPVTVKQATGTNLHAVIDTGSTTAVTQATGTNLHAVIDTGSTTAVTQATASNLNADVNVKTINAVTPLMGNGVTGTGSQRVTIASDNTAFAVNNTQQGTASHNVAQINGVTTLAGNGVTGTGSQRVTIASDNTAFAVNNTQQGTASQNVAQVNGVTTLTGAGASGTGSQRVSVANDSQVKPWDGTNTVTVKAASTAAAAADTSEVVQLSPNGLNPCLNPTATLVGSTTAMSGTSAVQIIGLSGSTKIYVCSLSFGIGSGTTPVLTLNYGTGTACATGTTAIITAAPILPSSTTVQSFTTFPSPFFVTPAGQELCYTLTGTTPTGKLILTYVQQ